GLAVTTSIGFAVTAAAATRLVFTVQPGNTAAGSAITPAVQVTAQDNLGNTVTTFTGTVTIAIGNNAGGGSLSGTVSRAAVAGVAGFPGLSVDKAGVGYTLSATASGTGAAASTAFNITPASAAQLVFTVQPVATTAGTAITPAVQVTARDAFGNTATGFTGTVTVAIGTNPAGGALSGTLTVAATAGIATFSNLSIDKSGTGYTLTAAATGVSGQASTAFNIRPGAATHLAFTVEPAGGTANAALAPPVQVTAQDAFGNRDTAYVATVTVALAANPGGATLSGTTSIAAIAGVATYSTLRLDKVGTGYTLTATASGLTSATSMLFNIVAGTISPSLSTVSASPGAITASTGAAASTITVTAKDASGNPIAGATVVLAATGTGNTLTQPAATTDASGVATGTISSTVADAVSVYPLPTLSMLNVENDATPFTAAMVTVPESVPPPALLAMETVTLPVKLVIVLPSASCALTCNGVAVTQTDTVTVVPAAASTLVFTVQPSGAAAGSTITPAVQVTARDQFGNTAAGFTGGVTVALGANPGGGTLSGTLTRSAVAGVATFTDLSVNKAGTGYTLTAAATGLPVATSAAFDVAPGSGTQLVFTVQPTSDTARAILSPAIQVTAQDAVGNTITSFTGTVTVALGSNPSGATLAGTTTVAAVNGVATFSTLSIATSGTGYTLVASTTTAGYNAPSSTPFNIAPGATSKLLFTVQPGNTVAGAAITPAVQVTAQDASNNVTPAFTGNVTMGIGANPGAGVLSGTLTKPAVAGVATFGDLSINKTGVGYTLTAAASGVSPGASSAFNIVSGPAAVLAITRQPSTTAQSGVALTTQPQVRLRDVNGNSVAQANVTITAQVATGPSGATLVNVTALTGSGGQATFSGLAITGPAGNYRLAFTSGTLVPDTATAIALSAGTATKLALTTEPSATVANDVPFPQGRRCSPRSRSPGS
ncbi:MAG: hemagglutinin, partial [Gemmatimonadetes bacterium]